MSPHEPCKCRECVDLNEVVAGFAAGDLICVDADRMTALIDRGWITRSNGQVVLTALGKEQVLADPSS